MTNEVLSGCAVRAVIQQEPKLSDEERHYLGAIKVRLDTLYELTEAPNVREQLSDEIGWVEARLGIAEYLTLTAADRGSTMMKFFKWYGLAREMGYRRRDAFREAWRLIHEPR